MFIENPAAHRRHGVEPHVDAIDEVSSIDLHERADVVAAARAKRGWHVAGCASGYPVVARLEPFRLEAAVWAGLDGERTHRAGELHPCTRDRTCRDGIEHLTTHHA